MHSAFSAGRQPCLFLKCICVSFVLITDSAKTTLHIFECCLYYFNHEHTKQLKDWLCLSYAKLKTEELLVLLLHSGILAFFFQVFCLYSHSRMDKIPIYIYIYNTKISWHQKQFIETTGDSVTSLEGDLMRSRMVQGWCWIFI